MPKTCHDCGVVHAGDNCPLCLIGRALIDLASAEASAIRLIAARLGKEVR